MANSSGEGASPDLRAELDKIGQRYQYWYAWPGVIPPLLYARRLRSSPPRVVRASTVDGLCEAIEADEAAYWARRGQ